MSVSLFVLEYHLQARNAVTTVVSVSPVRDTFCQDNIRGNLENTLNLTSGRQQQYLQAALCMTDISEFEQDSPFDYLSAGRRRLTLLKQVRSV